eukprot:3172310-Pleurochrysis_carterae.AAC.1
MMWLICCIPRSSDGNPNFKIRSWDLIVQSYGRWNVDLPIVHGRFIWERKYAMKSNFGLEVLWERLMVLSCLRVTIFSKRAMYDVAYARGEDDLLAAGAVL